MEIDPGGLDKYGEPFPPIIFDGKCNYQDKAKNVLTAEKKLIQINGTVFFPGDIAPELPTISGGTVTVNGEERRIIQGIKARNPDGTCNYCRLDVV